MTTAVHRPVVSQSASADAPRVGNRYGHFTPDGRAFCITDVRTPRPWANIISNPRLGLAVSQTGSGFTWIDNSQLAVITRWQQDLTQDASGKFLYVRDADSGQVWSLSPAPVWAAYDRVECRHGIGYTTFTTEIAGIRAEWTLFAHVRDTVELWRVRLHNTTDQPRRLEVTAYLEWNCGVSPSPRREFHKLFIETAYDAPRRAIFATNHMWEVHSPQWGHWNTPFPYVSALACSEPILSAQGDKAAFTGLYGDLRAPAALSHDTWKPIFGQHDDAVGALRTALELRPHATRDLGFAIAISDSHASVAKLLKDNLAVTNMDRALADVQADWEERLAAHRVSTPEASVDYITNDWLRYQAVSGRIWGRAGYYQQSGAYGFRDQLQDSQVWLTIDPQQTRAQIAMHARHQFADGSVYHWWHPLSEQGHVTKMTDDLLWLGFVTANYIKETGDLGILSDAAPFLDDPTPHPLREHVARAFTRVFGRMSPRGLPYIGAGDWNDGLSACGLQERGESIWLGQFLAGLLADWTEIYRQCGDAARAAEFGDRRQALVAALNTHGWDGAWYYRATLDDGSKIGSHENRDGRIFLNAQTWAILNDIAPPPRLQQCWDAVKQHLISEAGALLLAPAYRTPDERIGYITRYAAGLRENGGVYTHAATWAIAAACKMRDHALAGQLLDAMNPALKDPQRYWAEPYVLPGNVDGPDSPHHTRGGWTWYTGSAQWLHRVITQWVLGVRPEWDGLHCDPCLPTGWTRARMTRPWRGATLDITIERVRDLPAGVTAEVTVDGTQLATPVIAAPLAPGVHKVHVRCV